MPTLNISRLAGALVVALALSATSVYAIDTGGGNNDGGGTPTEPSHPPKPSDNSGGTSPSKPKPTLATARADIDAGSWTKAITDLKLFLKANSKSADGWNLLGYSYRQHGDLKLADTAYDRALKLNPNHTGALSYQGILYVKLGELDEAKANLAKIETLCGNTTCAEYVALSKALS
jgi:tetratricopeptide (TPR) repeat protein